MFIVPCGVHAIAERGQILLGPLDVEESHTLSDNHPAIKLG